MARQAAATPVRPIAHQSLVDRVTDELHRAILNGDIAPGSAVSIVELCEQFDVSHIPVREALRRLESEGVVSLRPGRSALVASLSVEDLTNIYGLRKLIEGDLVVRAMADMTEEQPRPTPRRRSTSTSTSSASRPPWPQAPRLPRGDARGRRRHGRPAGPRPAVELLGPLPAPADGRPRPAPETTEGRIDEHRQLLDLARGGQGRGAARRVGRPPRQHREALLRRSPRARTPTRPTDPLELRARRTAGSASPLTLAQARARGSAHGRPSTRSVPLLTKRLTAHAGRSVASSTAAVGDDGLGAADDAGERAPDPAPTG